MIEVLRALAKVNLSNFNYLERFTIKDFEFSIILDIFGNISASCFKEEMYISLTKSNIMITNLKEIRIEIPFDDLDQDDSYLILKYGRILTDPIKN